MNMRRICACCLLLLATEATWAYDFIVDGIYYNMLSRDDLTCEVSYRSADGYNTYAGEVSIPEIADYYGMQFTVVGIGASAFRNSSALTAVSIPATVSYIGDYAFNECAALTEVEVPAAVNSIGNYAFEECTALQKVNIPEGVPTLASFLFFKCTSLAQITIPESVTTIGQHALYETPIKEVVIPSKVTSIGMSAFSNCHYLRDVSFEGEVLTELYASAFAYCDSLHEIVLPNSVTTVYNTVFRSCSTLRKITFGTGITSIWYRAFYETTTLEEIYVLNPTPPGIAEDTFSNKMDKDQCTLYVPAGSTEVYASTEYWKEFHNIKAIEDDTSGIGTACAADVSIVGYYSLGGVPLSSPQKGVNIVRYADGTTKKLILK